MMTKTSIHNETIEILTDAKKLISRIQRAIRAGGNGGRDDEAIIEDLRGMLYILRLTSGCLDSQLIVNEKTLDEWDSIERDW